MRRRIKDLSPKMRIDNLENELVFPASNLADNVGSFGGLVAGSREMTHGKVTIAGVDEQIRFGDASDFADGVGVFMGKDTSDNLYKFRAGDPAGTSMYWDGSALSIAGFLEDGEAAADVNANATTIDGGKITANSVTAAQIAATTITANEIVTGTITATQIASNTITAGQIDSLTITASEIAADAIVASKIKSGEVSAAKLDSDVISGDLIIASLLTADRINAGTLTGITVQSSSGNDKIVLNTGDYIDFYIGGVLQGRIRGTSSASGGVRVVAGDLAIDNDYSLLFDETDGSGFFKVAINSSDQGIISLPRTNQFFMKNAAETTNYFTVSSSGTYMEKLSSDLDVNNKNLDDVNSIDGGGNDVGFNDSIDMNGNNINDCNAINVDFIDVRGNSQVQVNDDLYVNGTLSKNSGSFDIPHPDPAKEDIYRLRHSFVESPTAGDTIYRFEVDVVSGVAEVVLPDYFKHLNENPQVWVSPVDVFGIAKAQVDLEKVSVQANVDGKYNVLVVATRADPIGDRDWKKYGLEYKGKDRFKDEDQAKLVDDLKKIKEKVINSEPDVATDKK